MRDEPTSAQGQTSNFDESSTPLDKIVRKDIFEALTESKQASASGAYHHALLVSQ